MELFSALFVLITTLFWLWLKKKRNFWTNSGVDTPPYSLLLGHLRTPYFHGGSIAQRVSRVYGYMKSKNLKYTGLYLFFEPWFVPLDLNIVKSIMQSDFQYFMDKVFDEVKGEPLTVHLLSLKGQKWKTMRRTLTPAFSSGKIKMMFETLMDCTHGLKKVMDRELKSPEVDIKDILVVKDTVEYREKNNVYRKDLMQLLIDLKNNNKEDDGELARSDLKKEDNTITINELAAQVFIFFEAGFETSSATMAFCLYELSKHREIQDKVREEIKTVKKKYVDTMTYDAIMDMLYLEKVIFEPLRKYSTAAMLARTCTKRYIVPGTEIVLDEGMKVFIPVYGIQRDPKYYVNPEQFDPERFSDDNKKLRHDFAFLAFGEGPRMCIGMRFGLLQVKVALITLLQHYEFNLSKKSVQPLQWDPNYMFLSTLDPICLNHKTI